MESSGRMWSPSYPAWITSTLLDRARARAAAPSGLHRCSSRFAQNPAVCSARAAVLARVRGMVRVLKSCCSNGEPRSARTSSPSRRLRGPSRRMHDGGSDGTGIGGLRPSNRLDREERPNACVPGGSVALTPEDPAKYPKCACATTGGAARCIRRPRSRRTWRASSRPHRRRRRRVRPDPPSRAAARRLPRASHRSARGAA